MGIVILFYLGLLCGKIDKKKKEKDNQVLNSMYNCYFLTFFMPRLIPGQL